MVCNKIIPFSLQNSKPIFEIQNEALLTISVSYESLMNFSWHQKTMKKAKSFM
jgi:hypothetical protein